MSVSDVPNIVSSGTYIDDGDTINITITLTDSTGTAADPTTLTMKVKPPSGTVASYVYGTDGELTRTSTGIYVLAYPVSASGTHQVRAITTGDAGEEPGYFFARPDNTA